MKKAIVAAVFTLSTAVYTPVQATGIPVVDVASLTQQIMQVMNMIEQITQLKNQLETAKDQLETAEDSFKNMSGSRGLASVINSAYDTAVDVNTNGTLNDAGIKSAAEHGLEGDVADLYDSSNQDSATWLAKSEKSLEQAEDRFSELTRLIAKVNSSPDQKDILDLQARIAGEQAMLQNELAKLTMLKSEAQARQAMRDRRIQQMAVESSGELRNVDISWQ